MEQLDGSAFGFEVALSLVNVLLKTSDAAPSLGVICKVYAI